MSERGSTAAILAGGQSRRMGTDKALAPFAGRPLIEWVIDALRQVFDSILIVGRELEWRERPEACNLSTSSNSALSEGKSLQAPPPGLVYASPEMTRPEDARPQAPLPVVSHHRIAAAGIHSIADRRPGAGPLAGLEAALLSTATPTVFLVGCDMPFLKPAAILRVLAEPGDADAAVPEIGGRLQPLHAAYHVRALPIVQRRLDAGLLLMHGLLSDLVVSVISEDEMRATDPLLRSHLSINTTEQLAAAETEA